MTNDMPELPSPQPAAMRRIPLAIGAVVIGAVIGFAGGYGIGGLTRTATGGPACPPAVDPAHKLAPLAPGEGAGLTHGKGPVPVPGLHLPGRHWQAQKTLRLARAHGPGQSVGHLVRALPQGDAGA